MKMWSRVVDHLHMRRDPHFPSRWSLAHSVAAAASRIRFPVARIWTDGCGRRAGDATLHAGCLHRIRAARARQRVPHPVPPEESRVGATELVNATRGGSEGSGVEVYDPRTGKPLKFTYQQEGDDPENHAIHATLPSRCPGRRRPRADLQDLQRSAHLHHERRGHRLGPEPQRLPPRRVLPKGFAFLSSNVAAQLTTTPDGRLKLAFANPSGQSNPVTIHARKTTATFPPRDVRPTCSSTTSRRSTTSTRRTAGAIRVEQIYSDYRKGDRRSSTRWRTCRCRI